ncbi:hypothetical protein [Petrotoga sp. 9PWA.NaAc.5.4]|uniref:hypothetical protein n=1 Tax=Petrotoga sp. 9PWA.NaAc.5.4 TaxID=1434328 RepID=UPI000CC6D1B0|nr:hypothetical protein [Petrotoga sp. 9PWA.NaAc.5.4]PNR95801.1 hypothetical protein X924_03775 [Petrotoga sp. 9PWA.NaAc.5.4]
MFTNEQSLNVEDYNKIKVSSQIDFIRLLKNADDHESMIKLALLKETMNQFNNFKKEKK